MKPNFEPLIEWLKRFWNSPRVRRNALIALYAAAILAGAFLLWIALAYVMRHAVIPVVAQSFLLQIVLLTAAYLLAFVAIAASKRWIYSRVGTAVQPIRSLAFKDAIQEELRAIGPNPDKTPGRIDTHNNRRWTYLATACGVTFLIALGHPGAPLLTSGLRNLPADLLSPAVQESVNKNWDFLMHGWDSYLYKTTPATLIPHTATPEPSWFWWKALGLYAIATGIYFCFAFSDELEAAMKAGVKAFRKHKAKHEARLREEREAAAKREAAARAVAEAQLRGQRGRRGQQPPPAPAPPPTPPPSQTPKWWQGVGGFAIADVVIDILSQFVREFFESYHRNRVRRGATS